MLSVEAVAMQRSHLHAAGFHAIEVENARLGDKDSGKAPIRRGWQIPGDTLPATVAEALNTGIGCNGLRAIDLDIDNPTLADRCRAIAVELFGETLRRFRADSARCLLLYRAVLGSPHKIAIAGRFGKIEVLGHGNQFVAFGTHWQGAELQWEPHPPGVEVRDDLPPICEADVATFLQRCAPIIEAKWEQRTNGQDHAPNPALQADPLRVARALDALSNADPADWEAWNRIGMATWAATGGSPFGWEIFNAWSARNAAYSADQCRERWSHYPTSPPGRIGAGTIFHMEAEARDRAPEPEPPLRLDEGLPETDTQAIPFATFRQVEQAADPEDFVENLLVMGAMSVIYGQSNCGKSFFALALAICVAAGIEWRGHAVDRGAVLYLSLEGGKAGMRNRLMAIKQDNGWDDYDLPFAFITTPINLRDPAAHVEPLIATVRAVAARFASGGYPVRWIIVDTLARAMAGGNENASDDMGALVINCDRLRAVTGCHLTLLHHSGKDEAKGARGHSSLQAASDTEIEIVDTDGTRTVTVTKQRDVEVIPPFAFKLRRVEIGTNRRRKPITTCLVEYEGEPKPREEKASKGSGHAERALEVLTDLCVASGKTGYASVPAGIASVPEDWWRDRFYDRAMPGAAADTKKHAFSRASSRLINVHRVGMAGKRVWVVARQANGAMQHDVAEC